MAFMLTVARRMAVFGLAAIIASPIAAQPAAAAAGAELFITVKPRYGGAYSLRLTCDPDGGIHPRPHQACDVLRDVDGYFVDLDVDPGPCPLIWDPVTVEARGHWYGRPDFYAHEFPNECVMKRKLGPVV
ncbi:SSI family serine proteinase inhibitor [Nonomuraea purpurea]|uniref:SSI family serine proteinase inhibitor n=1 Tax=Nonomuraea purpurea TaxID=1849276 RepID=A0ABV8G1R5_9ACTN